MEHEKQLLYKCQFKLGKRKIQQIKTAKVAIIVVILSKNFINLNKKTGTAQQTLTFTSEVTRPLKLQTLINKEVKRLSGGQQQRIAIILALAKGAGTYLVDEPSAYLDSEERIICSKMLDRSILINQKSAFVVQHDFIMATYLADQVIIYEDQPGVHCIVNNPQNLINGMNKFLTSLGLIFEELLRTFDQKLISQMLIQIVIKKRKELIYLFRRVINILIYINYKLIKNKKKFILFQIIVYNLNSSSLKMLLLISLQYA